MTQYITIKAGRFNKEKTVRVRSKIFQLMPNGDQYNAALDRTIKADDFKKYVEASKMDGITIVVNQKL